MEVYGIKFEKDGEILSVMATKAEVENWVVNPSDMPLAPNGTRLTQEEIKSIDELF
jgi:hypothetical protein